MPIRGCKTFLTISLTLLTLTFSACNKKGVKKIPISNNPTTQQAPTPSPGPQGPKGEAGQSCEVTQTSDGAEIKCPNGIVKIKVPAAQVASCQITEVAAGTKITCGEKSVVIPKNQENPIDDNPLLRPSKLEYGAFEWDKLKPAHVIPALEQSAKITEENFNKIITNPAAPTFANTIDALEDFDKPFNEVAAPYFRIVNLLEKEYGGEIKKKANAIMDKLENLANSSKPLFQRVKVLYDKRETLALSEEQKRLLILTYERAIRNGIDKSEEVLKEIGQISAQIGQLQAQFNQNVGLSRDSFRAHITNEQQLKGLPARVIEGARAKAQAFSKDGYVFVFNRSIRDDITTYSEDSSLRKTFWLADQRIAYGKGPMGDDEKYDNRQIAIDIARLRLKKANLLGFKSHAHYGLQDKMASQPQTVTKFMDDTLLAIKRLADLEQKQIEAYKKQKGDNAPLTDWDVKYWTQKHKSETLNINDQQVSQYLQLDRVIDQGAFELGRQYWGLEFKPRTDLPKFHPDVRVFEVKEGAETKALLYLDLFSRDGKGDGAWVAPLRSRYLRGDANSKISIIHIAFNFQKPAEGKTALLSMDDAQTLFHEMGHAYHVILSEVQYASLAGAAVARDFVEVPSQVPENFMFEREVVAKVAINEKGEKIPEPLLQALLASKKLYQKGGLRTGMFELRQMQLSLTDMAWHSVEKESDLPTLENVGQFEASVTEKAMILASNEDRARSTSFSHIFAGGYDVGYYGYLWARVIGSDLYAAFTENGGFTLDKAKPVALKLRSEILAKGNSAHPAELFKNFRGRDYDQQYFLKSLELQ